MPSEPPPDPADERTVDAVVEEFVARWHQGEALDVDAVCAAHPELGAELRARLEDFAFVAGGLLEGDGAAPTIAAGARLTGRTLGPFELLQVLGEGGMGVVYLAEQREPIRRRVALKVIKANTDSAQVLARFRSEQQALARMEHDHIARILDAGVTDDGRPYFVMEHIRGVPLLDYCDRNRLTIRERLALFVAVCDGVQHAHQKGVIHRDLKPSNILVGDQGGRRVPKIIDFGLARATDQLQLQQSLFTAQGVLIGTPEYMSPEQAGFDGLDVDSRTDVYSLGVVLYELLTGELPFPSDQLRSGGLLEIQQTIRDVEPPVPSQRCSSSALRVATAAHRRIEPAALVSSLRGDLDWITMRAMEKDRARRYGTVAQLAADVQRHLDDEPVEAGPPGLGYRAGKLLRRHRVGFAVAGVVLAALVTGLVAALWQAGVAADALASYRRMRDVPLCQDLLAEAERDLWPAHPRKVPRIEGWLARARGLAARAAGHRERVARLAARVDAADDEARYEARFQHAVLEELVGGLDRLEKDTIPVVAALLERARTLAQRSLETPASAWTAAADALARADGVAAHALYRGMPRLAPQLGLVPLGMDPDSKLWEFAVLDSGVVPARDAAGRLQPGDDMAIVLVLIPPGTFSMGAQASDRYAQDDEAPATRVALDAFFLSKYEMTQGQWKVVMGDNPSLYHAPALGPDRRPITWRHPVDNVSHDRCALAMHRLGLTLPTEAQWEYAARAGTGSTWWTGDDRSGLGAAANVADQAFVAVGGPGNRPVEEDLDDGYAIHAPVGSFRANPFGLHDVIGNVWEWCRDADAPYTNSPRPGDGLREGPRPNVHACRGGSFMLSAVEGRSANRARDQAGAADGDFGVRPARGVDGPGAAK